MGTFRYILLKTNTKKAASAEAGVAGMLEGVLGCKWSLTVLGLVRQGVCRPGAMQRSVPGLSTKVLNQAVPLRGAGEDQLSGDPAAGRIRPHPVRPALRRQYRKTPFHQVIISCHRN